MYSSLLILFAIFLFAGIYINYRLFEQDQGKKKNTKFFSSERFLVFTIEILIAVIGFGVTLYITNANERQVEKDKAAQMVSQVIEFTDREITRERSYLNMYNKGTISVESLRISNLINLDYYNNILSTEVVLQNANMNTYGDIMSYLSWIEQQSNAASTADDTHVYSHMYRRYKHLKVVRDLLEVCHDELTGEITSDEAKQRCHDIKYPPEETTDAMESTESTEYTEYTIPAAA